MIFMVAVACQAPSKPFAPVVNGVQQGNGDYHRVKQGDTLYAIAWYYGYDYRQLAKNNQIAPPYAIKIGQKIYFTPQQQTVQNVKKPIRTQLKHKMVVAHPAQKNVPMARHVNTQKGQWLWPTKGKLIPIKGAGSQVAKGIDIAGMQRQPIVASLNGKVVYSGNGLVGYGNLIIVKHSDDYLSAYAYNAVNLVKEGENVKRGQKIALLGSPSGKTPRLHFEIRKQGKPVDPMLYLKGQR